MTEVKEKNVAVLGFGVEGAAATAFLRQAGAVVTVCDRNTGLEVPADYQTRLGDGYLDRLDDFDMIVPSPGIKRSLIKTTKPITSPTQFFFERCPASIIGVTGTKGKGTTATLITKILEAAGKKIHLGGNIGKPALALLSEIKEGDIVVLELSSFQLYDVTISPHLAVVLMVEPDHLDWHADMADYVAAKANIARFQKAGDYVVFHAKNNYSKQIAEASAGSKIPYLSAPGARLQDNQIVIENTTICKTDEVGLIGPHNLENICAAVTAAWQFTREKDAIRQAITEFKGLEHRLEFVREVGGVRYYDDSFSTNPSACLAALRSFDRPIILIAGGSDKKSDFDNMAAQIAKIKPKHTLVIGETASKIASALQAAGYQNFSPVSGGMSDFVEKARDLSTQGDVVLLSPACASFGLFTNYKQRGDLFKRAVRSL